MSRIEFEASIASCMAAPGVPDSALPLIELPVGHLTNKANSKHLSVFRHRSAAANKADVGEDFIHSV
jgi:hypothetical protein